MTWPTRQPRPGRRPDAVLGVCAYTHDSAAALLVDGALVGFAEEERLVGDKHTKVFPTQAVDWLLRDANLSRADIAAVGYNFQPTSYLRALTDTPTHLVRRATRARAVPRARNVLKVYRRTRARLTMLAQEFPAAQVTPVLHHRAHGLYAFASSGYDTAAVLVVDSLGETQTTTLAHARHSSTTCDYRVIDQITDPASLGYAYGAVTEHLGWRRGDEEGTVMALAALGDPGRFADLMARAIPMTEHGFALDPGLFPLRVLSRRFARVSPTFIHATCPTRRPEHPVEQVHADLAAALQQRTEQVMLHLTRRVQRLTSARRLCLSGGVAANCVAVGAIVAEGLFDEVHVPPAPGDSGTAVGAAAAVHLDRGLSRPTGLNAQCYLGPHYPDLEFPPHPRPGLAARRPAHAARFLAEQLANGLIVGLFHGRLEAGPRALGNRSILASPLRPDVVDRLNRTVKFREPFRPFAPVVLAEVAPGYFTLPQLAPYMSIASGVTDRTRRTIPTIVHTNGTARVQTVTPRQNPFLADVLTEFARLTGVPVLINTSLNIKGKPICGTPDMALDCLIQSGLDALMIEGWWIAK